MPLATTTRHEHLGGMNEPVKDQDFCREEEFNKLVHECNVRANETRKRKTELHQARRKARQDKIEKSVTEKGAYVDVRQAIRMAGGYEAVMAYEKYLKEWAARLRFLGDKSA